RGLTPGRAAALSTPCETLGVHGATWTSSTSAGTGPTAPRDCAAPPFPRQETWLHSPVQWHEALAAPRSPLTLWPQPCQRRREVTARTKRGGRGVLVRQRMRASCSVTGAFQAI